ncbi:MAG: hypothetical protein HY958_14340 [Bacteroidia bacterium]|nr:hypothetical protein [Bacteroidia bacterium]
MKINNFLILILLCLPFNSLQAQTARISNVNFDYNGQNIVITFDISGGEKTDRFNILPEIYKSNGDKIPALSFEGDVKSVSAGNQKKILWNYKKDGVELDNHVSVKLSANIQPEIQLGKHLLKSAIYPGWGDYKLREGKHYFLYGVVGYGCMGTSAFMGLKALTSFNNYSTATTASVANNYYNQAISQRTAALSFVGAAAIIWAVDMIFVAKRANILKKSQVPIPGNYYLQETKPVFAFSDQKHINTKAPVQPPFLVTDNLKFEDFDKNKCINANEETSINFTIENKGKGDATGLSVNVFLAKPLDGLEFKSVNLLGNLAKGKSLEIVIPVKGNMQLISSEALFKINVKEANGFVADPIEITIPTRAFVPPKIEITDYVFTTEGGGQAKLGVPINLKAIIQNTGQGIAKDVTVYFNFPENVFKTNDNSFVIGDMKPNESKEVYFEFFANKQYSEPAIPVTAKLNESWGKYAGNKTLEVKVNQELKKTQVKLLADEQQKTEISIKTIKSDVDANIPITTEKKLNYYAVIIGNEDYSSSQTGLNNESNVDFAVNDAQAERGVKIKPKEDILKGNTIVFASSSGDESSGSYKEKQHGMFTYFLLKKLQESKGNISIKDLFEYVETNVKKESVIVNNKKTNTQN